MLKKIYKAVLFKTGNLHCTEGLIKEGLLNGRILRCIFPEVSTKLQLLQRTGEGSAPSCVLE